MTNPTDTSPLRGPAQVFLDHERITAAWGDRYEIAVSFSGDLWLFRVRGDPPGTWTEASSSAEAGAAITRDFTSAALHADEEVVVVSRGGDREKGRWRR